MLLHIHLAACASTVRHTACATSMCTGARSAARAPAAACTPCTVVPPAASVQGVLITQTMRRHQLAACRMCLCHTCVPHPHPALVRVCAPQVGYTSYPDNACFAFVDEAKKVGRAVALCGRCCVAGAVWLAARRHPTCGWRCLAGVPPHRAEAPGSRQQRTPEERTQRARLPAAQRARTALTFGADSPAMF